MIDSTRVTLAGIDSTPQGFNLNMTTLSDDVLRGNLLPPEGYMDNYVIEGMPEAVEERLKTAGWNGKQPRYSVLVHFESKMVKYVQILISGKKEIGRTMANTLWG